VVDHGDFTNSKERAIAGFIATCVNLATGETEVTHRAGYSWQESNWRVGRRQVALSSSELLRELCRELDARPGDWRIRTLSSPTTVLSDLRGRTAQGGVVQMPEPAILTRLGLIRFYEHAEKHLREPRNRKTNNRRSPA
jgi:hypothetical protein